MLSYEGENHGLAREPNQPDYHSRILQWFGYYLRGNPAPNWISAAVPFIQQKDEMRQRDRSAERGWRLRRRHHRRPAQQLLRGAH